MTKYEIVETLARERRVETMVQNIAHADALDADLKDLAQMVYLVLLEYDDDKIADLWDNRQMDFFIARVILNQYRSKHSPWHDLIRKPLGLAEPLEGHDNEEL